MYGLIRQQMFDPIIVVKLYRENVYYSTTFQFCKVAVCQGVHVKVVVRTF